MQLKLVEQTETVLRFRNKRGHGWIPLGVGVLLGLAALNSSGASAWFALVFSALFLTFGGHLALARRELTIDLLARRFEGRLGYWPSPRYLRGSSDQIKRVRLSRSSRRDSTDRFDDHSDCDWVVSLELEGWPLLPIFWSRNESAAVERFEFYAERLQVPAVDFSGRTRAVDDQDIIERLERLPVAEPTAAGDPTEPPGAGSIVWNDSPRGATIELARGGYLSGNWFPFAFGVSFLAAGCVFFASALGFIDLVPYPVAAWAGAAGFGGIGILILGLMALGLVSRQTVREEASHLSFEWCVLGRSLHTERWPKRQVERIVRIAVPGRLPAHGPSISSDEQLGSQAYEVVVRNGEELVRLARGADEQTQDWLCRTLRQLAAR